jgi:hypothetical protein
MKKRTSAASNKLQFTFLACLIIVVIPIITLYVINYDSSKVTTLTLTQSKPTYINHPVGSSGAQVGDMASFEAPLIQNNAVVGELSGTRTLVETSDKLSWTQQDKTSGSGNGLKNDMWLNTMVFDIYGKGTIIAEGQRLMPTDANAADFPQMSSEDTESVAVIGGTGEYKFAHGQLTTTRHANGDYTQVFTVHLK